METLERWPLGGGSRRWRTVALPLAAALFAAIFALRLVVDDPDAPVLFLLALPIAIVATELGLPAGVLAGVLGLGLFGAWGELREEDLGAFAYLTRAVTFVVVGAGIGFLAERHRAAATELARANQGLRQANRELEQFASMAAHDLRTPLAVVAGFANLVRDRYGERLGPEGVDLLDQVNAGVDEMRELVDGMLEIARHGSASLEPTDVEAGRLVDEVVRGIDLSGRDAHVSVEALPTVRADPQRLRQVFANLLSNALKFADDPVRVQVSAQREGDDWRFEVADDGPGVPEADAERIFEPLQRGDSTRTGMGIGLAVCRRIVESHGGRIGVRAAPGGGSVFWFTLPAGDGLR